MQFTAPIPKNAYASLCVTRIGATVPIAVTTQNSILKIEISACGTDVDLYV
jgi:hypothetical protein